MQTKGLIQDIYKLTPAQEGMLFHTLYDKNSPAYFVQLCFKVLEDIDVYLVEQSFNELFRRYDILRTSFVYQNVKEPLQVVLKERRIAFSYEDLCFYSEELKANHLLHYKENDINTPFDLTKDVLMRLKVFKTAPQRFEFVWSRHHILMDGWSQNILLVEFFKIYSNLKQGKSIDFKPGKQFKDYLKWVDLQDKSRILKYWNTYLAGYLETAGIPKLGDSQNENRQSIQDTYVYKIEKEDTESLNQIARKYSVTLNNVLSAIWGILLSRYNNTDDVVFGTVASGRNPRIDGVDSILGLFMNTLPCRLKIEEGSGFCELLKSLRLDSIQREEYSHISLSEIHASTPLRQNLFNHLFVFENHPADFKKEILGSFSIDFDDVDAFGQTNYDFNLFITPQQSEIEVVFLYNKSQYSLRSIKKVKDHFHNILGQIINNPEIRVDELELMEIEEKRKLLFSENLVKHFPDKPIHELFEEQAKLNPDTIALEFENKTFTYRDINEKANQLAHYLRNAFSVKPDTLVGLLLDRSEQMVIGMLGVIKAGAAYIPIDPSFPSERISYILDNSKTSILITDSELELITPEAIVKLNVFDCSFLEGYQVSDLPKINSSDDLMYVIYTSGSTGNPKGVQISHRSVANFMASMQVKPGLKSDDKLLALTTYSFDISVLEIFLPLTTGARVILVSSNDQKNPKRIEEIIRAAKPTIVQATPSYWSMLISNGWQGNKGLKVLCGGEPLSRKLGAELMSRCNSLWNMYGPTETTIWSTIQEISEESDLESIGSPINNTTVYIFDSKRRLVPEGVVGELHIGGVGLAKGYFQRDDLNNERFISNPLNNERLYRTGDLARWKSNGSIEFLGRNDFQVKVRGYRIELGEIENQIQKYSGVKAAVVLALQINDNTQLVAYIISDDSYDEKNLRDYLLKFLPIYMVPSFFVKMDVFPQTPNGKIDRKAFPSPLISNSKIYLSPRTTTEEQLAKIFEEVLSRQVSIDDNFFEIGGQSLKAVQIVSRIHKEMGVQAELRSLFSYPTVATLAEHLQTSEKTQYQHIEPVPAQEHYPVSHAQKRLWVLHQLEENLSYNIPGSYEIVGKVDVPALERAFTALIDRHEILRTVFITVNGEPRQKVNSIEDSAFKLMYQNLIESPGKESIIQLAQVDELIYPFDLAKGPLFKAQLFQIQEEKYILLFTMHHIISDGWSIEILTKELLHFYSQFSVGRESSLPPLKNQYKDFAVWERNLLQQNDKYQQYWLNQYADKVTVLKLPYDNQKESVNDMTAENVSFEFAGNFYARLQDFCQQKETTVFLTLHAVLKILLHKYSGTEEIIVGTAATTRDHHDLENQIGNYVNTLPLKTTVNALLSFNEFLSTVINETSESFKYRLYPYENLVENLRVNGKINNADLFNVGFTWNQVDVKGDENKNLSIKNLSHQSDKAKADLWLHGTEEDNSVTMRMMYRKALFKTDTITLFVERFKVLIEEAINNPELPIANLDFKLEVEQELEKEVNIDFDF